MCLNGGKVGKLKSKIHLNNVFGMQIGNYGFILVTLNSINAHTRGKIKVNNHRMDYPTCTDAYSLF